MNLADPFTFYKFKLTPEQIKNKTKGGMGVEPFIKSRTVEPFYTFEMFFTMKKNTKFTIMLQTKLSPTLY